MRRTVLRTSRPTLERRRLALEWLEDRMAPAVFTASETIAGDFGNDFQSAYVMTLKAASDDDAYGAGAEVQGELGRFSNGAFDADVFRFEVVPVDGVPASAGVYSLTVNLRRNGGDESLDGVLYLYDANQTLLTSNDDVAEDDRNSRITWSIRSGQTYYVRAEAFFGTRGEYLLTIDASRPLDDVGDSPAEARTLEGSLSNSSLSHYGEIEIAGDVDCFRFIAPKNGRVLISQVATIGSGLDPSLAVFDSPDALDPLASNDDAQFRASPLDSMVQVEVTAGQSYFVRASASELADPENPTTGRYRLSIAYITDSDDFDDAASGTHEIRLDSAGAGSQFGSLERVGDVDWFKFTAKIDGPTFVTQWSFPGSSIDCLLQVYRDGNLEHPVAQNDDFSAITFDSQIEFDAEAGVTYYVKASSFEESQQSTPFGLGIGEYMLTIRPVKDLLRLPVVTPQPATGDQRQVVSVWTDSSAGSDDVWAQRFDADGDPIGAPILVAGWPSQDVAPAAAVDAAGNFVVVWQSDYFGDWDVFASRYDAEGSFLAIFPVAWGAGDEMLPAITMHPSGNFVIAWQANYFGDWDIYANIYDAFAQLVSDESGNPYALVPLVQSATDEQMPAIAMDSAGILVVTWTETFSATDRDVYARIFDPLANPLSERVAVAESGFDEFASSVATAGDGTFLVAWTQTFAPGDNDVGARFFDALGEPLSGAFAVSAATAVDETAPAVAADASGNFAIAWNTLEMHEGVPTLTSFAQAFFRNGSAWLPVISKRFGDAVSTPSPASLALMVTLWLAADRQDLPAEGPRSTDGGGRPQVAVNDDGYFVVVGTDASNGSDDVWARVYDPDGNPIGERILVAGWASQERSPTAAIDAAGNFVVVWQSNCYGDWDVFASRYDREGQLLSLFPVTWELADEMLPAIAMHPDGNFVIAWQADYFGNWDIYANIYDSSGQLVRDEFGNPSMFVPLANSADHDEEMPALAMDGTSSFVVSFTLSFSAGDRDVYAFLFDAFGHSLGDPITVANITGHDEFASAVARTADETFLVAWTAAFAHDDHAVYAQIFDPLGQSITGPFGVAAINGVDEHSPAVAMDRWGNFAIAWSAPDRLPGDGNNWSPPNVYFQRYLRTGSIWWQPLAIAMPLAQSAAAETSASVALNGSGELVGSFLRTEAGISEVVVRRRGREPDDHPARPDDPSSYTLVTLEKVEPNATWRASVAGTIAPGSIDGGDGFVDIDYFRFTAPATGTLLLSLTAAAGSTLDCYLEVYDDQNRLVALVDNFSSWLDSFRKLDVVKDRTYTIWASGAWGTFGTYDLTLRLTAGGLHIDTLDDGVATEDLVRTLLAGNVGSTSVPDPATSQPVSVLAGNGLGFSIVRDSIAFVGANQAAGLFSGGDGVLELDDTVAFDSGMVLGTGDINLLVGPNYSDGASWINFSESNEERYTDGTQLHEYLLEALATLRPESSDGPPRPVSSFDAAALYFEFIPDPNVGYIEFQFVFGSEEYNEFVQAGYSDAFGFFVNGVNYARLDPQRSQLVNTIAADSGDLVSIDNVNLENHAEFYVNNSVFPTAPFGILDIELDGLTTVLTVRAPVNLGERNQFLIVITDVNDASYDSAVFLRGGSLVARTETIDPDRQAAVEKIALAIADIIAGQSQDEQAHWSIQQDLVQMAMKDSKLDLTSGFLVIPVDPVDYTLAAPNGNEFTGTGQVPDIPNAFFTSTNNGANDFLIIAHPQPGDYRLTLAGIGTGDFRWGASYVSPFARVTSVLVHGKIEPGAGSADLSFRLGMGGLTDLSLRQGVIDGAQYAQIRLLQAPTPPQTPPTPPPGGTDPGNGTGDNRRGIDVGAVSVALAVESLESSASGWLSTLFASGTFAGLEGGANEGSARRDAENAAGRSTRDVAGDSGAGTSTGADVAVWWEWSRQVLEVTASPLLELIDRTFELFGRPMPAAPAELPTEWLEALLDTYWPEWGGSVRVLEAIRQAWEDQPPASAPSAAIPQAHPIYGSATDPPVFADGLRSFPTPSSSTVTEEFLGLARDTAITAGEPSTPIPRAATGALLAATLNGVPRQHRRTHDGEVD